jgi:uncharacterized damage-inducible protein DinB
MKSADALLREHLARLLDWTDAHASYDAAVEDLLRELLLVADHGAHHIGQLVLVRRLLGAWPAEQ